MRQAGRQAGSSLASADDGGATHRRLSIISANRGYRVRHSFEFQGTAPSPKMVGSTFELCEWRAWIQLAILLRVPSLSWQTTVSDHPRNSREKESVLHLIASQGTLLAFVHGRFPPTACCAMTVVHCLSGHAPNRLPRIVCRPPPLMSNPKE